MWMLAPKKGPCAWDGEIETKDSGEAGLEHLAFDLKAEENRTLLWAEKPSKQHRFLAAPLFKGSCPKD